MHDLSVPAFEAAGNPALYPEHGEAWQPSKLYFSTWSRERIEAMHEKFLEFELESPFEGWSKRPSRDHLISTRIPILDYWSIRKEALLAHETQVDPKSPFWFGLPDEVAREVHPYDDYILALSKVDANNENGYENDLFDGINY